jgi:hypothetical protein
VPPPPVAEPARAPIPSVQPAAAPPSNPAAERRTSPSSPRPARNEQVPDDLASEREDAGYAAASRLGGLRNLLVSLGRRSLNNNGEPAPESDSDLEPRFERATVRPAYSDTPLPAADAGDNGSPARLTAQPEFLPPKPVVEGDKEKEAVRAPAPRRDYPEAEEIQTLPSWRGQYRKKRYPPM